MPFTVNPERDFSMWCRMLYSRAVHVVRAFARAFM